VIGEGSIVGGNVWLTRSVPPGSKIYYQASMTDTSGKTDTITFK
jgi:serine O-acetyltransferase